jgi:membrane-associated phospholipid phosphatase
MREPPAGYSAVVFVLIIVLLLSGVSGIVAGAGVRRWPQADPALSATHALEGRLDRRGRVRGFVRSRLDPAATTGLVLTLVLIAVVVTGVVFGVVIYMVRTKSGVVGSDQSVARWAATHVEGVSFQTLRLVTALGSTPFIVAFALACAVYGWRQRRGPSVLLFLVLVVGGQFLISNGIKFAVERVRPDLSPFGMLGTPSFPSGHSTAAAATFAALALVLGRDRSPRVRAILVGAAVAVAVAVGCSRALLGVHWFSDVVAGLLLGWTWFAVCAVAFGGRLLWFGAPAESTSPPRSSRRPAASPRA